MAKNTTQEKVSSQSVSLFSLIVFLTMGNKKQRRRFFQMVSAVTAVAGVVSALPILFSLGIDAFTHADGISLSMFYITAFALALLVTSVLEQAQWLMFGPFNMTLTRHLTTHIFDHTLSLPYALMQRRTSYEISYTIQEGLDAVQAIIRDVAFFIGPTLIELAVAASVIGMMLDPWVGLTLMVGLLFYGYVANVSADKIRESSSTAIKNYMNVKSYGLDAVVNLPLVQQANLKAGIISKLDTKLALNENDWRKTFYQRTYYGVIQAIIFGSIVILILWRSTNDVAQGLLSIGELVLINTYIMRLLKPVETLATLYREVHASAGKATLLLRLLEENPIKDDSSAGESEVMTDESWSLRLENIQISVEGTSIIEGLSLSIPANTRLFIVGPSGVGKSSLLRVLSGLILPDRGAYFINNSRVTHANSSFLKNFIAVAQQECFLFDATIDENIALGGDASQVEREQMLGALGLHEVVERHRQMGEPTVGERGNRLSGGEKQRIALARAFLSHPKILLLDEPTTALDEVTRARVMGVLEKRKGQSTDVIVTHDLQMLDPHDDVLFLVGLGDYLHGTHANLLENSGVYADFCRGLEVSFLNQKIA
jgi:ABC-type bacteriocin/lantibiotic exporter with double-glycine peptidase domain